MAAKKQEYIITNDDIYLLDSAYCSVRPLSKKSIASKNYKPKEMLCDLNEPPTKKTQVVVKAFDISSSGGLSKSAQRKMDSGNLKPDTILDLHGMNLNQAFAAFESAISSAYQNQNRLLLVITGKGKNNPLGSGALRRELPRWLSLSHIGSKVIRASNAAPKDGGDGAFYILIKRLK